MMCAAEAASRAESLTTAGPPAWRREMRIAAPVRLASAMSLPWSTRRVRRTPASVSVRARISRPRSSKHSVPAPTQPKGLRGLRSHASGPAGVKRTANSCAPWPASPAGATTRRWVRGPLEAMEQGRASGVAGGRDGRGLRHEDHGPVRRAGAMHDAARHHESLERLQVHRAILEIDDEVPLQDEEELVVLLVLVPVVLALHDAQADDRVVDLAQRLVVPAVLDLRDEARHVHHRQGRELHVEEGGVGIVGRLAHRPRLSASFSIFWNTSAGLSRPREYSWRRLMSAIAASRSTGVGYQCRRCHSGPRSLRNGSPGGRLTRIP